jgi:hypothetical protein
MLSNHRKKQKEKVKDAEFDIDIVAKDLEKVINKHIKRKTHGFDIACALADVSVPSSYTILHLQLRLLNIYY